MTTITYHKNKMSFSLDIDGHAGYGVKGQDIVCAGISTLAQTLAERMQEVTKISSCEIEDGKMHIAAVGAMEPFETVMTGFRLLAENYPHYVKIVKV